MDVTLKPALSKTAWNASKRYSGGIVPGFMERCVPGISPARRRPAFSQMRDSPDWTRNRLSVVPYCSLTYDFSQFMPGVKAGGTSTQDRTGFKEHLLKNERSYAAF
ncbi:MAG: hypothetical protein MI753_07965 [Hyphomicrobiales bacterium]|nr:hypothetical protein [Hyphomicrobiales bacterium]